MAQFGEVRVDFITYTTGVSPSEGTVTTSVSGLVNSPTFTTVKFASGTAAEPSITFTGDSDTGFFTDESNTISLSTSGIKWVSVSGDGSIYSYGSGALQVPVGDTSSRPSTALTGMIRFNTSLVRYEGYKGGDWSEIGGGGATGSGGDQVFVLNEQVVTTSYTFPSGNNATSCGPITINDGVEVIIGDDQNWAIV